MRRPIVFVFIAGLAAMLAAMMVFSALKKRDKEVARALARTVDIVVAAHDLPIGSKIDSSAVKLARWSRDSVPPGAFNDPQAALGDYTKTDISAGEPLVDGKLFSGEKSAGVLPLLIPAGMRAMSVAVDEVSDVAGFVQPHAHVDVLVAVSATGQGEPSFSRLVLQDIEVVAVAQEIEHNQDQPEVVKVVTLLVTPIEAEKLTLATREGTIRLAMRKYGDNGIVATSGISIGELLHGGSSQLPMLERQGPPLRRADSRGPQPLTVEIMRDGHSTEALSFIRMGSAEARYGNAAPGAGFQPLPSDHDNSGDDSGAVSAAGAQTSAASPAPGALLPPPSLSAIGSLAAAAASAPHPAAAPMPSVLRPDDVGYKPTPKTIEIP